MSTRFLLAQISDPHVRVGPRADGFDSVVTLRRALDDVRRTRADAIIATGDLTNDAQEDEYQLLAEVLREAPAPLYLVPGNHDDPALIRKYFPDHVYLPAAGPLSHVVDDYPLRIVALDDIVVGQTHGEFTEAHAAWLDAALNAAPLRPTILALHHPPIVTHDRLLDTIGLKQAERFAAVVARHRQIIRIICGHNHRIAVGQVAHAPVLVAPSTAWSFNLSLHPDQPVARRTKEPPGWALHAWTEEGGLASHVLLLTEPA
jgi:Icc protein